MPTPYATIITLGNEIVSGAKLDTNSGWLSQQLSLQGIPVRLHLSVADDLEHIVEAVRSAKSHSRYIFITGGLGPTLDDLTRQALANAFKVDMFLHEPSLEYIQSLFARRHREMPERNRTQAMFPQGSQPIPNPHGTAPGIIMEYDRDGNEIKGQIFALPGVPSEMKSMYRDFVLKNLASSGRVISQARIHCFGLSESHTEELLENITQRGRNPEVGITAHEATITLRLQAMGDSEIVCKSLIDKTKETIYEKIGDYIYGEDDDEMEDIVFRLLKSADKTLSVLESGTGGLLAQKFHQNDSCEKLFVGGTVVPSDSANASFEELVEQTHRSFRSDFTLAIDGWDRKVICEHEKFPRVKIILHSDQTTQEWKADLVGVKELERIRIAKIAMKYLIDHLRSLEANS